MTVPVADQKRLSHILADDLQPRIDWAYALEQVVALLGGGYVTPGNGDPNGLVTKPEGYLFLDLTTPAVWQNQNGGTVWAQLGTGGGSGLPPQWTDGGNGNVTATVDDVSKTAITIEAFAGQTAPLLDLKDEAGNPVETVGPTGRVVHAPAPTGNGNVLVWQLQSTETSAGTDIFQIRDMNLDRPIFNVDSSGGVELQVTDINSQWQVFDSGFTRDPTNSTLVGMLITTTVLIGSTLFIQPRPGQTAPLLQFIDLSLNELFKVTITGAAISNAHAEPADAALNNSDHVTWLDDTPGAVFLNVKAKDSAGAVYTASIPMTPA